jgi:hypothetical protein
MGGWGPGVFENDVALVLLANLAHWNRGIERGQGPEWVSGQLRILFASGPGAPPAGTDRAPWGGDGGPGYEESGAGDAHRLTVSALVIARALQGTGPGGDELDLQDLAGGGNPGIRASVLDRLLRVRRPPGQVSDWLETAGEHRDLISYEDARELLPAVISWLQSRRQAVAVADEAAGRSCQAEIGSMLEAGEFCVTLLAALQGGE